MIIFSTVIAVLVALTLAGVLLKLGSMIHAQIPFLNDPVYVPSTYEGVANMLKLAQLKPGEVVIDLGSGDGRILIESARLGCKAIGYEIMPWLVWWSRWRVHQAGLSDLVSVQWRSFWQADFSQADVVFLYAAASIMPRLEKKLRAELPKKARVVTQRFAFPSWPVKKHLANCYLQLQK